MNIVIIGLSITSSWGNGHATTYRGLVRGLASLGHRILFLENDVPWYAQNRDLRNFTAAEVQLYSDVDDLIARFEPDVRAAGLVILGSYVNDGVRIGEWITSTAPGCKAFYDIDTPVTLAQLERGESKYLSAELIPRFDIYLSFTGGDTLRVLESRYGAPMARVLYCAVDPGIYEPLEMRERWLLGYLGTYSEDRQAGLETLLLETARELPESRFAVAGPMYPETVEWPENVDRLTHLAPPEHREFYGSQRFSLNLTRLEMRRLGYSPSVRLFEAACCGVPVISDWWAGIERLFIPGKDIFIASDTEDVLRYLRNVGEVQREEVGARARKRVLREHTPEHRARQLEEYVREWHDNASSDPARGNSVAGKGIGGLETGHQPERGRTARGGESGADAGGAGNRRGVFQSFGTRPADGGGDRESAPGPRSPVARVG